jgi:anti-sigma regulatory factor (Ser/Thr protein kinase)
MSCQRLLPDVLPPGDVVQATHHVHLQPLPRQVGAARAFVRDHAPPLSEDACEVLMLLTSELVTNAVLHARTDIEVGITIADHSVLVTVHDEDLARPEQRPYHPREGGWGLGLVTALAARSAMTHHPGEGKTAWFVLPRGEDPDAPPGVAQRPGQDELGTAGL